MQLRPGIISDSGPRARLGSAWKAKPAPPDPQLPPRGRLWVTTRILALCP